MGVFVPLNVYFIFVMIIGWLRLNTVQLEPFAVVPSSLLPLPPLRHPTTRASEPLAAGWSASSETQTPEASGLFLLALCHSPSTLLPFRPSLFLLGAVRLCFANTAL